MAKFWFTSYHMGNTICKKEADTVGALLAQESINMEGAFVMISRNGEESKVTDLDTALVDGDTVTVQKGSVKSGSIRSVISDHVDNNSIPRLVIDDKNNVVLINREVWKNNPTIFSGTLIHGNGHEIGFNGNWLKHNFTTFNGQVTLSNE